jgi:hypothetical protein
MFRRNDAEKTKEKLETKKQKAVQGQEFFHCVYIPYLPRKFAVHH